MALFWLCYRKSGQISVAIMEAPSLIHARMRAALDGTDAGTMLSCDEAAARMDRGERPPSGTQQAVKRQG